MSRVAVILSGCGVFDGAEIHESVLTMLALESNGLNFQCFAPDKPQLHVVDHLSGEVDGEASRNCLIEAARIARGQVQPLSELQVDDYDALLVPGGFGAAKNLCDFALVGTESTVDEDFFVVAKAFAEAGKPAGYLCIAPMMLPAIYGEGVKGTIGKDAETAAAFNAMGGEHQFHEVNEICIDEHNRVVSTPAYMLAGSLLEAQSGIDLVVTQLAKWLDA